MIYLAAMLRPVSPMLSFYSNYDYFAKERCENKARPEKQCNGKCQMKRMVKENSGTNGSSTPVSLIHADEIPVSIVPQSEFAFWSPLFPFKYQADVADVWAKENHSEIWHPPCAVA
jgi:hypothetical protein